MIFVGGTSSSGKSTTIDRLIEILPVYSHLTASSLLRDYGRPLRPLTVADAAKNQDVLVRILADLSGNARQRTLLDGHAMIETISGLWAVPDDWYARVRFTGFVHIEAASGLVAERRQRRLLGWNDSAVRHAQAVERDAIRRQAEILSVPFLPLESGNVEQFAAWLAGIVS